MSILLKKVVDFVEAHDVGTFSEDMFIGQRPSKPIDCITFYDTPGRAPRKDQTSDRTFQVITRNKSYPLGIGKAGEVQKVLKELYQFWLGNTWVIKLEAQNEPGHIGRDENGNHLFSANYNIWIKE